MPCSSASSCLSFASAPDSGSGSDSSHVTEKHYGCYKAGILFALAIILLLLVGCVPVFVLTANNNLILLILLATLVLIGLTTFAYFRWQRKRALAMRRTYEQQKFALTRVPKAATGATSGSKQPDPTYATATATTPYGPNGTAKLPATMEPTPAAKSVEDQDGSGGQPRPAPAGPPRYSFI